MPNVQDFNCSSLLKNAVDDSIHVMGLAAIENMTEPSRFVSHRPNVRVLLQAENGPFKALVPAPRRCGTVGVNLVEECR